MKCLNLDVKYLAVENPTPFKIAELPPYTQAIQPYEFGHPYTKKTLLWLKNLPPLIPTNVIDKSEVTSFLPSNVTGYKKGQKSQKGKVHTAKKASKTFDGVAKAMAEQWSKYILENEKV